MRVLLQSFETGLYLDTSGDWTNTSDLARNFRDTRQAAEFKIHHRLSSVFVVVQPEPTPQANVPGTHDKTNMHAQDPANPVGPQVKAIPAELKKEPRSAQRKSPTGRHQRGLSHQPCHISP
jgi:hypothetical protein